MGNATDITGIKFGRLTALELDRIEKRKGGGTCHYWYFKCDCGKIVSLKKVLVMRGHTKSCGCLKEEWKTKWGKTRTRHGQRYTRLYQIWIAIKKRCYNPKCQYFYLYGGRGITMCKEWKDSFQVFSEWAYKNGYDKNARSYECTIDRINVNGNYNPENCRFVSQKIQNRNTRRNRMIEYKGKTHCISEWAEITGINADKIRHRLNSPNWTIEKALTTL